MYSEIEQKSNINNATILIVDDAPANIQILSEVLSDYKCKVAINGRIALKLAEAAPQPDIILLDIIMPGMDGFEVCEKLKSNKTTKDIPVIFITAKNSIDDEIKGLKLGAVDFLSKPISPPSVLARVKNYLDLRDARNQLIENNRKLEDKNKYITDSIRYAKHIQSSLLKSKEELSKFFEDSFLYFAPKDIVSGDFYWFHEVDNIKIVAVVDCTGHGVPGAFMGMLGNTKLNEIIIEKRILNTSEILNQLNQSIIDELHKELNPHSFDGMDIGICAINGLAKTISYSGAYRPLYILEQGKLKILKGNRKSIGEIRKTQSFTNEIFYYTEESKIFLFSDGLSDQNNSENKKFGSKKIQESLVRSTNENIEKQCKLLLEELKQHRGSEIQRDDITLLGFKP